MDFFKRFKELYNFAKSNEKDIFVNTEAWIIFQNESKKFKLEDFEMLYKVIVHYHYIETKILEDYPYKLKIYSETEGGIVFDPKNLPLCLQYMLLNW